jgi:hypothetical protein
MLCGFVVGSGLGLGNAPEDDDIAGPLTFSQGHQKKETFFSNPRESGHLFDGIFNCRSLARKK